MRSATGITHALFVPAPLCRRTAILILHRCRLTLGLWIAVACLAIELLGLFGGYTIFRTGMTLYRAQTLAFLICRASFVRRASTMPALLCRRHRVALPGVRDADVLHHGIVALFNLLVHLRDLQRTAGAGRAQRHRRLSAAWGFVLERERHIKGRGL